MIEYPFEDPDIVKGADWLELSCFLGFPASISKTAIDGYFSERFEENELFSTDILRHIEWRKQVSSNYPFEINGSEVVSRVDALGALEYLFPLLLSTHDFFSDTKITNWSAVGDLFELFCTESIESLIGNALLIGNAYGGFSPNFDECLEQVCKILNEKKGPIHPKAKDFQDTLESTLLDGAK